MGICLGFVKEPPNDKVSLSSMQTASIEAPTGMCGHPLGQLAAVAFFTAGSGLAFSITPRCCPHGFPLLPMGDIFGSNRLQHSMRYIIVFRIWITRIIKFDEEKNASSPIKNDNMSL